MKSGIVKSGYFGFPKFRERGKSCVKVNKQQADRRN